MQVLERPISEIKPYGKNAKKHPETQVRQIAESIKAFGFNQPIVVDKHGVIIVGHGRFLAAQALNLETIPVLEVDIPDEAVKSYRLSDNRLNESDWDMALVIEELKGLTVENIQLTGFDRDLTIKLDGDDDRIPNKPKTGEVRTQIGDLYELGDHRILCGDSTKPEDIKKLMGGATAKLLFTSPPYNMGSEAGLYASYKDNLEREKYIAFNLEIIKEWTRHLKGFMFWNISYNKKTRDAFMEIMNRITKETGQEFLELIVWNKRHAIPINTKDQLTRLYEDILLTGDADSIRTDLEFFTLGRNDRGAWFNRKTQKGLSNYWEIVTGKMPTDTHGACYPVALPIRGITLMTEIGEIVADPFLGAGTTIIAAHKSNRKGYGMELDPEYVDVAVERWCQYAETREIKRNGITINW